MIEKCNRCGKGKLYFLMNDVGYKPNKELKIKAGIYYGCDSCGRLTFEFFGKREKKEGINK